MARGKHAPRRAAGGYRRIAPWLLLALLGCGGPSGADAPSGETETGELPVDGASADESEEPAVREAIAVALPQLPRRFDPLDDLEPWALRMSEDLLFEGLVRRGGSAYPWVEPALADRCEVDREYAVATVFCHVPRGIRFHDGRELSVEDVVYSLSYWIDPRRGWLRQRHGLAHLERVEIVDGPRGATAQQRDAGRWVRIGFGRREPLALEALAAIKIVPRELHRGQGTRFAQQPVGTGPMRMSTLSQDRIILERFDDYHGAAPPTHKYVFRAIDDGAQALTALRRGEVHLLPEVAPVHIPVELGKPGMSGRFTAWLVSPPRYDLLLWNLASGVQAGPKLREALHDALPLAGLAREVYGAPGLAIAAPVDLHAPVAIDLRALEDIKLGEPVRGGLLAMPDLTSDFQAQARAAAALDALGWPVDRGLRRRPTGNLRATVTWDGRAGRASAVFERIKAAWSGIGVQVPQATASWTYLLVLLRKGEFKAAMVRLATPSDADLYHLFHTRGASNWSGVSDRQLDAALTDYRGAADRAARDAAKQRVAQRLAELRVVSMLNAPTAVLLASRRLEGLVFVDDLPRLDRLRLTPDNIDWGS